MPVPDIDVRVMTASANSPAVLPAGQLDRLLHLLRADGYDVVGPHARDGAIVLAPLLNAAQLPRGWTTAQDAGSYRLRRREDAALFGFTHGADSWKKLLHPARVRLWAAERQGAGFVVHEPPPPEAKLALFGVRACDLRAIEAQDRVLLQGPYPDAEYEARRRGSFIVTVDCAEPSGTCFCVSMGGGPAAKAGFDLALTELGADDAAQHRFIVRAGSARGADCVERLGLAPATATDLAAGRDIEVAASARMGRQMDAGAARTLLETKRESAHWQDVAQRCLTCGNCTMVCPTCFCTNVEDTSDLTGDIAERWRVWDSCFTLAYSWVVGATVRESAGARYRHWITHKLSSWHEQFGESGCVGCGRCITWCPVGIDITQEIAALQGDAS